MNSNVMDWIVGIGSATISNQTSRSRSTHMEEVKVVKEEVPIAIIEVSLVSAEKVDKIADYEEVTNELENFIAEGLSVRDAANKAGITYKSAEGRIRRRYGNITKMHAHLDSLKKKVA